MTDWIRVRNNFVNVLFSLTAAVFAVLIISIFVYQINLNLMFDQFNVGFSKSSLGHEYLNLISYLINPFSGSLRLTYFAASPSGLQHFADVKLLVLLDISLLMVSFALKLIYRIKLQFYKNDAMIISSIPIIIGLIVSMDFNDFFVIFHQILFNNNNWLFNPVTDPIINVLPDFFFEQLIIMFLIVFEILIFIGYLNKKELNHD
ncbi:membrane protein [Companilactobacillus sp. RD055328]|uniref:TIGR01906 family membrane protein n=1 Tax=Companilactobacillus sp. RD055328 TaxID=2916634 RepID=UPI001FC8AF6B|nr:TIGR01906 family membrane protein [Companilactobacillus sp. RD055328]GKQ42081.1 membrane protein [Companilactobacillus sp. RD055328]